MGEHTWNKFRVKFNHHENLPQSFRMLIVGPSGCGKTSLLFDMLLKENFIDYNNLIIFSKTIDQPEYQLLYHGFKNNLSKEDISLIFENQDAFHEPIPNICEEYALQKNLLNTTSMIEITFSNKFADILPPDKLNKTKKNLIIFDDCVSKKNQEIMESYFTRGRHNNCNVIYLSQSWYELPGRMIRGNANFVILFKLNKRNKDAIYADLFSTDELISKQDLDHIWNEKYAYVALNKDTGEVMEDVFV